jgi:glycerophosphoryl diester phosphodiesterase
VQRGGPAGGDVGPGAAARALLRSAWQDLRRCLPALAGFDVLFRIVLAAIIGPLGAFAFALLLSTRGGQAVSNFEIAGFLLSPAGLLYAATAGTVALALGFAQQAGAIMIAAAAHRGSRLTSQGAVMAVARMSPRLMTLGLLQLRGYVLAIVPFAVPGAVAWKLLLTGHDINYYFSERPAAFWVAACILGGLGLGYAIVAAVLFVRWLYSVPVLVFEQASPREAMRRSRQLAKRSPRLLAMLLAGWLGASAAASALAGAACWGLGELILPLAGHRLAVLVPLSGALAALDLLVAIAIAFAGSNGLFMLIAQLYLGAAGAGGVAAAPAAWLPGEECSSRRRVLTWVAACLLLGSAALISYAVVGRMRSDISTEIIAHRGSSRRAPENTLSAIKAAIEDGADWAEIDVQETSDGIVVLLHDSDLFRATGLKGNIWEITHAELMELDAGAGFGPGFAGERIPTLEEAIEAARGRIGLLVELKFNGHDQRLAERVVEIIEAHGAGGRHAVMSLDAAGLARVRSLAPDLPAGLVLSASLGDILSGDLDFVAASARLATRRMLRRASRRGVGVYVWTVNDHDLALRCLNDGVSGIITDDPALVRALRDEAAAMDPVERLLLAYRFRAAW